MTNLGSHMTKVERALASLQATGETLREASSLEY